MLPIVALSCSFGVGLCFSLLGAISVALMPRLQIDQARFGSLVTAFMSVCLVASLFVGMITDRLGYKPVAVFGFLFSAACILFLARSRTYAAVFVSCLLLGCGAMALNTAGNTLIPRVFFEGKNPAAASNLGNVAFGVGLSLAPLLASFLFCKVSYESTVSTLAGIVAAPTALAGLATYPESHSTFEFSSALALLSDPPIVVAGLALFCYAALDVSLSNWLPTFGKEVMTVSERDGDSRTIGAAAQRLISVYALSLILGRLLASQWSSLTEYGSWFVAGASLVTTLLVIWMTLARRPASARNLVFLVGLTSASFFPTIVGVTFAKYSTDVYGSVFGIIFAWALLGGAIVPKAIGNLARGSTVQKSMRLLIPLGLILAVLGGLLSRI